MCSVARAARWWGWGGGGEVLSVRLVNVSCTFTCVVALRHMPRQITEQRAAAQSCQLEPNPKTAPELQNNFSAIGTCRRCRRTPCPSPPPGRPLLGKQLDGEFQCFGLFSSDPCKGHFTRTLNRKVHVQKPLQEPLSMPMRPSTRSLTGAST